MTQRAKLRRLAFIQRVPCVRHCLPAPRRAGKSMVTAGRGRFTSIPAPNLGLALASAKGTGPFCPILPMFRSLAAANGRVVKRFSCGRGRDRAAGPVRRSAWSPVSVTNAPARVRRKRTGPDCNAASRNMLVKHLELCRVRPGPRCPTWMMARPSKRNATSVGRRKICVGIGRDRTVVRATGRQTTPRRLVSTATSMRLIGPPQPLAPTARDGRRRAPPPPAPASASRSRERVKRGSRLDRIVGEGDAGRRRASRSAAPSGTASSGRDRRIDAFDAASSVARMPPSPVMPAAARHAGTAPSPPGRRAYAPVRTWRGAGLARGLRQQAIARHRAPPPASRSSGLRPVQRNVRCSTPSRAGEPLRPPCFARRLLAAGRDRSVTAMQLGATAQRRAPARGQHHQRRRIRSAGDGQHQCRKRSCRPSKSGFASAAEIGDASSAADAFLLTVDALPDRDRRARIFAQHFRERRAGRLALAHRRQRLPETQQRIGRAGVVLELGRDVQELPRRRRDSAGAGTCFRRASTARRAPAGRSGSGAGNCGSRLRRARSPCA